MTDYLTSVARVPFLLGRPEDLPETVDGLDSAAGPARTALAPLEAGLPAPNLTALLDAVRSARSALGETDEAPVGEDPSETEENRDNDLAFGIVRMSGNPLPHLLRSLLDAYEGAFEVAQRDGAGLSKEQWHDLAAAPVTLLRWLAAPDTVPGPPPAPPPPAARSGARDNDALRRWVRGHHVFMVLSQGMAVALDVLCSCADSGRLEQATASAVVADVLMRASAGALAFAGDATPADYSAQIRPTLMPPVAPPKMSGLHWRDHEALILRLRRSGAAWEWLAERRPGLVDGFRASLSHTYESHRGVCARFVGDQVPSLLATGRSRRSAVGVLEQLHGNRLGFLPDPPPPPGRERRP